MMNKYGIMSVLAIAIITAQVAVAADSPEMAKAKTEIDTLISNKNKAGLQALAEWIYFESKSRVARAASHAAYDAAHAAAYDALDAAHAAAYDAGAALDAARATYGAADFNNLLSYILKGVVKAGIALDPIDGLSPQCIAKAIEHNVAFYPKIDCSKLK